MAKPTRLVAAASGLLLLFSTNASAITNVPVGKTASGLTLFEQQGLHPSSGLYRLADNRGKVVLVIDTSCGTASSVRISRHYHPAKDIGGNKTMSFRSVSTSYEPYFKGDLTNGLKAIGSKGSAYEEPVPFNVNPSYAPNLAEYCTAQGTPAKVTPAQADNWYNWLGSSDIESTEKKLKPLVKPTGQPDSDAELTVGKPEYNNPTSVTYDLVRQKGGNQTRQTSLMRFNVVCGPGAYTYIELDRDVLFNNEVKVGDQPESFKVSTFIDGKGKEERSSELWFMRTEAGQNKRVIKMDPAEAPTRNAFCNGTKPIVLDRANAMEWYGRMGAMIKKNGLNP